MWKAVEITEEDIGLMKKYLKYRGKKGSWCALSTRKKRFIRHYSNWFFLGGDSLYRKTENGSVKVHGPLFLNRFQEKHPQHISPIPCEQPYTVPADSPFADW
ncbi:hypothetical protein NEAUS04_1673 [Nematocida ausubeli]|uniref:Uncharacterized protein n=1 Tax=Nematocida ausubeli (strain ATCC PRA-371 / ERTm2) TaxID=1913371 RepID=H8ZFH4_NEMA1|nr:uncharacterized protein NESG_00401 [Nematocida ausubeli]EHY64535.1 hypothetical protein NERG_02345 [Nematocida ausubeli]KAI5135290.1 hypothetical protein NEAUS06_1457 [Nematocida ausubeli]KAI5137421.1 hypothetical protein NEAUS07_1960 [Nematocida ausubeli]KAI5149963.1 hypothetical protein NEAUS05_1977 [Nematocida ausubeli]KAI5163573.1 hypothetical protein NEAUS04_1673 [Nematocida ausubeli]